MAERFTFVIIPDSDSSIRRMRMCMSRNRLFSLLGVMALLCGALAFLFYNYTSTNFERSELQRLRVENSRQRQDIQRLALDLKDAQVEMRALVESESRVRQLAQIGGQPGDTPVAIGGLPEPVSDSVDDIQRSINQLMADIELRRQSQEDVRNLLNDKISLSRATPQGWPTKGWITSYFGKRKSPFTGRMTMHEGLDIAANTGTPVYATADGVVARVTYTPGYGKQLAIDHGYGYRTIYAHNSKILVKRGARVKRGDRISLVGNTGRSTGSHLHYELQLNGVPIDPRNTL